MKKLILAVFLIGIFSIPFVSPAVLHAADAQTSDVGTTKSPTLVERIKTLFAPMAEHPPTEQDRAIMLAREGKDEEALVILSRLHDKNKTDENITRDYITVLGWSGRDQDAVNLYETITPAQPDYVLAAVGHSYRQLNQTDKALAVYRFGLQKYPNSDIFAEGEIRCMADKGDLDGALTKANEDLKNNGDRPAIVVAKKDIIQAIVKREDERAVELARAKNYPEALTILHNLYTEHSDDANVTRDYLAVLGWSENHDDQVIALYRTLPPEQPDYVLEAVGHSYRKLRQPEDAQKVYELGLNKYPDNVIFAEGQIRSLADQKKYDAALAKADADLALHGQRPEIVDAKKNILRLKNGGGKKPVKKKKKTS